MNVPAISSSLKLALKPITLRQERFVSEYMKDGNATQAAIRAGYSERSAYQIGHMLLRTEAVATRVEALRAELRMGDNLTAARIRKEVARIAFFSPKKLIDEETGEFKAMHELDDDTAAAIASIENEELFDGTGKDREKTGNLRKLKIWDKGRALELGAKIEGLVREQQQLAIGHLTIVLQDC